MYSAQLCRVGVQAVYVLVARGKRKEAWGLVDGVVKWPVGRLFPLGSAAA